MVRGKPDAVGVVPAEDGHVGTFDRPRDEDRRQAVAFRPRDILAGRADRRRHDHTIGAELKQRIDERALLLELVVVVRQEEGLPAAIQFALDRAQDFREEGVHDVVHHDADDSRPRRAQTRRASVVNIADRTRIFLDALPCAFGDKRAIAKR